MPVDLALVIPAHNDHAGLTCLLQQARDLALFVQIIVVDDGSAPPIRVPAGVELIRNETAQGGGVARNIGLRAVKTAYVLFFDADDALTPEIGSLWQDLCDLAQETAFDLCLFKHADSRTVTEGLWGQPVWDETFWRAAGIGPSVLAKVETPAIHLLAQTANYPWNKILRTGLLRDHAIGCAPTPVHNDIPLHWLSFFHARTVLVSARVCALHYISPQAGRLTNQRGRARFEVFKALDPVEQVLRGSKDWQAVFARFTQGLFDWITPRVGAEDQAAFLQAAQDWRRERGLDAADPQAKSGPDPWEE